MATVPRLQRWLSHRPSPLSAARGDLATVRARRTVASSPLPARPRRAHTRPDQRSGPQPSRRAPDVSSDRVPWRDASDPSGASHRSVHPGLAASLGVSSRMLEGRRFVRIHPRVWRHRDHEMTAHDYVRAAALALPAHAHTTGITRIQQLGLDFGPRRPLRFVVAGRPAPRAGRDLPAPDPRLPPTDGVGVAPAAAFVAYCARARVLDAIKVGDWLLHHGHMGRRRAP